MGKEREGREREEGGGRKGRGKGGRGGEKGKEGRGRGGGRSFETVVYQWTTAVPLKLLKALKGGHDSSALAGRDLVGLVFAEL